MPDAYRLSITETTREIQNKNLSPVSLAETLINRIDKLDPELKAWVTVDREDVIGQATVSYTHLTLPTSDLV